MAFSSLKVPTVSHLRHCAIPVPKYGYHDMKLGRGRKDISQEQTALRKACCKIFAKLLFTFEALTEKMTERMLKEPSRESRR